MFSGHTYGKLQTQGCWFAGPFAVFSWLLFASLRVRVFLADGPQQRLRDRNKGPRAILFGIVAIALNGRMNDWLLAASLARPPRTTWDFDLDFAFTSAACAARRPTSLLAVQPKRA